MIRHYLKLAIRNLLKYKLQSAISIIGLAVGFTCFALATLWIRYERTYDTFHDGADRIYMVRVESFMYHTGISEITPSPLAAYLKETFPEIENACNTQAWNSEFKIDGEKHKTFQMAVDSATMALFQIQIINGSRNFMQEGSEEIAITEQLAARLFGKEDPLGKELDMYGKYKICAIAKSWDIHSNLPFEILTFNRQQPEWNVSSQQTFIKLKEGVDANKFEKKLRENTMNNKEGLDFDKLILTPITAMRYDRPSREATIKYEHILLFASAGGLVILCALFNYLTLFVTRIRMRGREIALRKACGSSDRDQLLLFGIEYLITLVCSLIVCQILIELAIPRFKELSEIKLDNINLCLETIKYSGITAISAFLLSLFPIYHFKRKTLNAALKGSGGKKSEGLFSRISIVIQFIIGIGFIFCSTLLMKQIHYLNRADFGLERKDRGSVATYPKVDGLKEEMAKIPFITEVFPEQIPPLFPRNGGSFRSVNEWEGRADSAAVVNFEMIDCSEAYFEFYGLHLLEGNFPSESDPNQILVNQTGAKELGMSHPVGKTILKGESQKVITGVVKDFYIAPPTVPTRPMMLSFGEKDNWTNNIIFKFQAAHWANCKQRIEALIKQMSPDASFIKVESMQEEYENYLKSENALLLMLDFVTLVCIIISLFGVFSLVTLDCEQHRKEIAIRKVNGAVTLQIMRSFIRKYTLLLCIASLIAFPVGYLIMKRWIEKYVLQTSIDFWIYPAIWLSLLVLILLCTGWRIWKASNQNPAEVIKSE